MALVPEQRKPKGRSPPGSSNSIRYSIRCSSPSKNSSPSCCTTDCSMNSNPRGRKHPMHLHTSRDCSQRSHTCRRAIPIPSKNRDSYPNREVEKDCTAYNFCNHKIPPCHNPNPDCSRADCQNARPIQGRGRTDSADSSVKSADSFGRHRSNPGKGHRSNLLLMSGLFVLRQLLNINHR